MPQSNWAHVPQLLSPHPRACAPQQEKAQQEKRAPQLETSPFSLQLEKAHGQQQRPQCSNQSINKNCFLKKKDIENSPSGKELIGEFLLQEWFPNFRMTQSHLEGLSQHRWVSLWLSSTEAKMLMLPAKFYKFRVSRLQYGEGNGTPLQYSCLENPMDGEAW